MSNFWAQSPASIPRGLRANEACIRNAVGYPHQRTGEKRNLYYFILNLPFGCMQIYGMASFPELFSSFGKKNFYFKV
jgi:hypothetical protein